MIQPSVKREHPAAFSLTEFFTNKAVLGILVGILCYVLVFSIIAATIAPKRYDLKVGDVAKETIKATKDVVDQVTTQSLVDQARAAVNEKYKQDETITAEALNHVNAFFITAEQVRLGAETEKVKSQETKEGVNGDEPKEKKSVEKNRFTYSETFLDSVKERLPIDLTKDEITVLLNADSGELGTLNRKLIETLSVKLQNGIKEEFKEDQIYKIRQDLADEKLGITRDMQSLGVIIASSYLKANMIYDQEATELAREKAMNEVEPIVYKKGQNIIRESEPVTQAQIQVLDSLGLLKSQAFDITLYIGIGMLTFVLMLTIALYLYTFEKEMVEKTSHLIMLGTIICLILGLALLVKRINPNLIPVPLAALLITILLKPRLALIINVVLSILVGMMMGNDFGAMTMSTVQIILISIIGGTMGVYIVNRPQQRNSLIISGIVIGAANMISLIAIGLMTTSDIKAVFLSSAWGFGNGILSSVLCIGTLPIWEYLFDIITPIKLLELSNPNQPLLKKLLMEAPGTYHHSIIVSNLSDSAASAIGANPLLARVGSYYHDAGKLKRPYFFKENQVGPENPHDKISPNLSTLIITSHPKDGIQYAKQYKLPKVIQDIILEHHGTTPVLYFYHKAKNSENREETLLENFRYEGPKPQSREAAIIMLADTVEAAVRALAEPTPGRIEGLIRKLIKEKLDDGQLDECKLTLRDLDRICDAFSKVLCGIFHERIEYPDVNIKEAEGVRV